METKKKRKARDESSLESAREIVTHSTSEQPNVQSITTSEYSSGATSTSPEPTDDFTIVFLDREENIRYGWGRFAPNWLQWCCTPQFLLVSLMFVAVCQGVFVHGLFSSSWKALEGRFHFTTMEMATIRVMYDIGLVVGFIPVVYFDAMGAKRSTWIGISCLVMGLGAMTCAMPHFFIGTYDIRGWEFGKLQKECTRSDINASAYSRSSFGGDLKATVETDDPVASPWPTLTTDATNQSNATALLEKAVGSTDTFDSINEDTSAPVPTKKCQLEILNPWKYVFMLGVFLNGLGGAAYFTMGIAFMDESVDPEKSVLYTAALNGALLLGVGLGLGFNAEVLPKVHAEFNWGVKNPAGMTANNPRWRGAWWLGMVTAAVMSGLAAVPIFGFPRQLPGVRKTHFETIIKSNTERNSTDSESPSSVWTSMKGCLSNVTYLGLTLEQILSWAVITSFTAFMPHYLRRVYGVDGKVSRLMTGMIVLFTFVGTATGTFVQYYLRLSILGNLRFALASAFAFLFFLGGVYIDCLEGEFAGWTSPYPVASSFNESVWRNASCNKDCISGCTLDDYREFCYIGPHPDNRRVKKVFKYYSPCFAGCAYANSSGGYDCSCVPKGDDFGGGGNIGERCDTRKCLHRASAAVVAFCWCAMLLFARMNPLQHSLLRCIPFKDRVVGLTMSGLLARLLGSIPISPIMGHALHRACRVREQICGKPAACHWRDAEIIASKVAIVVYVASAVGLVGLLLAYWDQEQQYKKQKRFTSTDTWKRPKSDQSRSEEKGSDSSRHIYIECDEL